MANKTESHVIIPALELGIEHLGKYVDQLDKFDKHVKSITSDLGNSHKDQNYDKFIEYFEEFWPKILEFRKDVLGFNEFLRDKKKLLQEYNNITVKD